MTVSMMRRQPELISLTRVPSLAVSTAGTRWRVLYYPGRHFDAIILCAHGRALVCVQPLTLEPLPVSLGSQGPP